MKKILVISPHPDDEIIGCGATLSKYKNSKSINWVIITKMSQKKGFSKKKNKSKRKRDK